ncbi:polysaccharide biosynthesis tyrosine autokinase [Luteimonas sp. FXH3W]|uniref:Polysaccharide biosynthesis tyrosine autokinase n=1 Tax=Aquilutibacter rugosus TaxID=3115820 RepID=A0ABU7UX03_9GAMM
MSNEPAMAAPVAGPAAPDRDDDEIDLLQYWNIVRRNRFLIAAIAGICLALALVLTLLATPIFRAASMLQIEREAMQVLNVEGLVPTEAGGAIANEFYQTQYTLLASQSQAQRVAQDLNLIADPHFKEAVDAVDDKLPAVERAVAQRREVADALLKMVTVEPVRNSRLVKVNVDSPDAGFAARIANAWGDAFIAANLERRFDASSYARKYLEERLAQLKARLADSEAELVNFASQQQIISVGEDKPSLAAQNLGDLNGALATAQQERIKAQAEWNQAASGNGLGLQQTLDNPVIQNLRTERAKISGEYQEQLRTYKPGYPDMQRLAGQIAELDRQIAAEIGNVRASVKAKYDAAQQQENLLKSRITGLKGDVLDLQNRSIQYNILKREAETNRQLYDGLLQRYKEIGVAGGIGANNIFVVDRAEVPENPYKPRLPLNLAIGLLLGLMLGVLAAFARHFMDRTVHSGPQLEQLTGRPVLGVIPRLDDGVTPAEAALDLRSPFSESYRSVRTALQFATTHGLPASLLITSPNASEGKSTTAMELAHNIAQLQKRVVLIDADLRNPSVHKLMSLPNGVGLSSVLSGAADIAAAMQRTAGGLPVITSGPIPPNPPELLAGEGLTDLLSALSSQFDVIVLDGPPVLGLADAPLLGNKAEATILVASADSTRNEAVTGALARLTAARANVLGSILLGYDLKKGDSYGYGGYTYYNYGNNK